MTAKKIGEFNPNKIYESALVIYQRQKLQADFRSTLRGLEQTESILVQYNSEDPLNTSFIPEIRNQSLYSELMPFLNYLNKITNSQLADIRKLFIANLPAQKKISMHQDPIKYKDLMRFHWVLSTNESCRMIFRREKFFFAKGEIWTFNNLIVHGALNEGLSDRWHIIIDIKKNAP